MIYTWYSKLGETTIFHVMIWNHPIETTIYKYPQRNQPGNFVFSVSFLSQLPGERFRRDVTLEGEDQFTSVGCFMKGIKKGPLVV